MQFLSCFSTAEAACCQRYLPQPRHFAITSCDPLDPVVYHTDVPGQAPCPLHNCFGCGKRCGHIGVSFCQVRVCPNQRGKSGAAKNGRKPWPRAVRLCMLVDTTENRLAARRIESFRPLPGSACPSYYPMSFVKFRRVHRCRSCLSRSKLIKESGV